MLKEEYFKRMIQKVKKKKKERIVKEINYPPSFPSILVRVSISPIESWNPLHGRTRLIKLLHLIPSSNISILFSPLNVVKLSYVWICLFL